MMSPAATATSDPATVASGRQRSLPTSATLASSISSDGSILRVIWVGFRDGEFLWAGIGSVKFPLREVFSTGTRPDEEEGPPDVKQRGRPEEDSILILLLFPFPFPSRSGSGSRSLPFLAGDSPGESESESETVGIPDLLFSSLISISFSLFRSLLI